MLAELQMVDTARARVYSIGHSNHSMDNFLKLLVQNHIEHIIDTRSYPNSKYAPHFSAYLLRDAVESIRIGYHYMGKKLGGRPSGEEFYDEDGRVLYYRVADTPLFIEGIKFIETRASRFRIALMCSEENPLNCHRRLLIGRVLKTRNVIMDHIRGDGRIQADIELGDKKPLNLFSEREDDSWKSTQSVLHKRRQPVSLEH